MFSVASLILWTLTSCTVCGEGTHKDESGAYPRECVPNDTGTGGGDSADTVVPDDTSETVETGDTIETGTKDTASTDTAGDTGAGDTSAGDTGEKEKPLPTFDCASVPGAPTEYRLLDGAVGYHGVVFDEDGYIYGSDNNSVLKANYAGDWSLHAPGVGEVEQFEILPDGDIITSSERSGLVLRISPEGAVSTLATDVGAYGLRVGADGMVYAANMDVIYKIHPDTGEKATFLPSMSGFRPKVMDWSVDLTKMYIGTIGNGRVFVVDLDESGSPMGDPVIFATDVGGGWHDGLGVDICGNVYVADYNTLAVYRVSPDGSEVETWFSSSWATGLYTHGFTWGREDTEWDTMALYGPQPYNGNTVSEIYIGVPYRTWEGIVLDAL